MIGQSNDDRIWQPRVSESSKYRSEKSDTKGILKKNVFACMNSFSCFRLWH